MINVRYNNVRSNLMKLPEAVLFETSYALDENNIKYTKGVQHQTTCSFDTYFS